MSSAPRPRAIARRAAYKLIELDERFGFLKGAKRVVDLGIAPGGWTQVVRQRLPQAAVVGIDLLPTDPIDGATILQMDFMDEAAPGAAQGGARRPGRPRPLGHGRQHGRPSADRSSAHHGPGRGGARFRRRGAAPGRRLRRQGAGRRRRLRAWSPSSSAASPPSSTPSRRPAARARPNGTSSRRGSRAS